MFMAGHPIQTSVTSNLHIANFLIIRAKPGQRSIWHKKQVQIDATAFVHGRASNPDISFFSNVDASEVGLWTNFISSRSATRQNALESLLSQSLLQITVLSVTIESNTSIYHLLHQMSVDSLQTAADSYSLPPPPSPPPPPPLKNSGRFPP